LSGSESSLELFQGGLTWIRYENQVAEISQIS